MSLTDHQNVVGALLNAPNVRPVGHGLATGAIVLSWVNVLGPVLSGVATIMAILWYGVTLYESATVQNLITRWKAQRVLGPKIAAQRDAANKVIVAVDAVAKAAALPDHPADEPKS